MSKHYQEVVQDITVYLGKLHKEIPSVMQSFGGLAKAATENGALDKKHKELIALALAVATHCDGCI